MYPLLYFKFQNIKQVIYIFFYSFFLFLFCLRENEKKNYIECLNQFERCRSINEVRNIGENVFEICIATTMFIQLQMLQMLT